MITLDGNTYSTFLNNWSKTPGKFGSTKRSITGVLIRLESGFFEVRYRHQLLCTLTDITNLNTSFAKTSVSGTPPTNLLNFVDEAGFNWNPASGANDSTHAYSTGIVFATMGTPQPVSPVGWITGNRFLVDIELIVKATGLTS